MLVLSRKNGESVRIDGGITITVLQVRGNRVKVGIEAPQTTTIMRSELEANNEPSAGDGGGV
jgi:carbon storage regulator